MEELYLNGQRVELGTTKISQTLQINDLAELKDRQLNFTNQFTIPRTPKNIAIMDFLGVIGSTSRLPYTKIEAKLVLDGIELIKIGKAVVSGVSEKGYEVAIYSGNIDFYEALEGKKVNELDYNDVNHFLNLTSFEASLTNAAGYIYALAQWGYGYLNGQIDIAKMSPVLFLHTLIDKIIAQAGFTYSGDVFSDAKFLKEVVSPTKGYDVNAAEFTETNLGDVTTNEINRSEIGKNDPENYIDQFLLYVLGGYLKPRLSNFRIENAQPSRVYFDASSDITGLTKQGFIISGYLNSDITLTVDVDRLGGYFTVTTAFTFWDNNTIRLSGGDGTLYDFTLTYIKNNINEPATTLVRYAAPTTQGTGDGMSEANAWSYSDMVDSTKLTSTGTLVHVKAGTSSAQLNLGRSGEIDKPIIYKGYKTTPGDLDGVTFYNYGDGTPSGADAPLLSGSGAGQGFYATAARNYIIIKNFQIENYNIGVRMYAGEVGRVYENMVISNCTAHNFYSSNTSNSKIRIKNSICLNAGDQGVNITGSFNLAYNVKSYGDIDPQDYYIMVEDGATNNSMVNCYIERLNNISHSGHGYAIKGGSYTLVDNCICKGINAPFQFRHIGANNCVVKNSFAYGNGQSAAGGIVFRDGASNNVVENCFIQDVETATYGWISFFDSSEGTGYNETIENNIVRNTIFYNSGSLSAPFIHNGIDSNASAATTFDLLNNKIYNNTFYGNGYCKLFENKSVGVISGNEFKNNIVKNVPTYEVGAGDDDGWTLDYNLFHGGFTAQGINALTIDPSFADLIDFEPTAVFTNIDIPKLAGVNYDFNNNERASQTTIGAVMHADEVVSGGGLTNASLVGNSIQVSFTGQLKVSLSLVSSLDAGTAGLQIRKNGTQILYQALPGGSATTLKDIYVNVTNGDILTVWLYSFTEASNDPDPIHDLIVTADCSINLKSVSGGQYVDFSLIMTDKKQLDVMKDFMQCYGLIFKTTGSHLTFIRMEDLYNDRLGAEAWTAKLVDYTSDDYEVGAYAKKNIMKYSYEEDATVTHDGELIIDNENLDTEKTLFTSIYRISTPYTSINLEPVYQIPIWEEKNENGVTVVKNKDTSFRKFSLLDVSVTLTFKFADLVGTTTVTTMPFLSLEDIDYETYIADNYPSLKRILDKQLKKVVRLNLNIIDIYRMDFFKLKYFSQFGRYYYLNKVDGFIKGKATKCELIEV